MVTFFFCIFQNYMSICVSNGMDSHIYVYTCPTCMYVCVYQERKHSCQDRLFCVNKMKKHCMREVENNWMCVCVLPTHTILLYGFMLFVLSFPGGSEGKASTCNAGDQGSIPGLGRSPGEGNGNPF